MAKPPKTPKTPNGATPGTPTPGSGSPGTKQASHPGIDLPVIAMKIGLDPTKSTIGQVFDEMLASGVDPTQAAAMLQDPAKISAWADSHPKNGAGLQTNVDPSTPRTETDISVDPTKVDTKPGGSKKKPSRVDAKAVREYVSAVAQGLGDSGTIAKNMKLSLPGLRVEGQLRKPGQAVDVAAEAAPGQAKAGGRRGKSAAEPKPGSREWAEKQDEAKKKEYYDKRQNPPWTVGLESALSRNWPTIARVGGLALGGATIGAGIAGANYLMGRGGPAAPAQPNAADAEARAEARRMRMEELRIPQANPAGTMDVPPTKLDRILKSRSQ